MIAIRKKPAILGNDAIEKVCLSLMALLCLYSFLSLRNSLLYGDAVVHEVEGVLMKGFVSCEPALPTNLHFMLKSAALVSFPFFAWSIELIVKLFGLGSFQVRLVTFIPAIISLVLLYCIVRKQFGVLCGLFTLFCFMNKTLFESFLMSTRSDTIPFLFAIGSFFFLFEKSSPIFICLSGLLAGLAGGAQLPGFFVGPTMLACWIFMERKEKNALRSILFFLFGLSVSWGFLLLIMDFGPVLGYILYLEKGPQGNLAQVGIPIVMYWKDPVMLMVSMAEHFANRGEFFSSFYKLPVSYGQSLLLIIAHVTGMFCWPILKKKEKVWFLFPLVLWILQGLFMNRTSIGYLINYYPFMIVCSWITYHAVVRTNWRRFLWATSISSLPIFQWFYSFVLASGNLKSLILGLAQVSLAGISSIAYRFPIAKITLIVAFVISSLWPFQFYKQIQRASQREPVPEGLINTLEGINKRSIKVIAPNDLWFYLTEANLLTRQGLELARTILKRPYFETINNFKPDVLILHPEITNFMPLLSGNTIDSLEAGLRDAKVVRIKMYAMGSLQFKVCFLHWDKPTS